MKKKNLIVLAEIAIFAAIGFVLDLIANFITRFFPNGGSIGIAMIAVIIITYRRGIIPGFITGLLMGLLDMTDGYYAIADTFFKVFFQIGFDYLFGYAFVCVCGFIIPLCKKNFILFTTIGAFIGGMGKYLSHFLSGIFFWPEFPNQPFLERVWYSIGYNGSYMIPSIILSAAIICLLAYKAKMIFEIKDNK